MKNNLIFFVLLTAVLVIASCSTTGSKGSKKAANPFGEKPVCSTTDPKNPKDPKKTTDNASGNKSSCRIPDPPGDVPTSWDGW